MRSSRSKWLRGLGVFVLVGSVLLTSMAVANDDKGKNPFTQILQKLDQILAAITSGAGEGNHTLRWDTNNLSASRFVTAFTGAVLDKNTRARVGAGAVDGTNNVGGSRRLLYRQERRRHERLAVALRGGVEERPRPLATGTLCPSRGFYRRPAALLLVGDGA